MLRGSWERISFRYSLIVALLFLATIMRVWQLDQIPPGLNYDEAYIAMDAAWMTETLAPQIYYINNSGHESLFHHLAAIWMFLVGVSPYTFRLVAVFAGILTLPLLFRYTITLFESDSDSYWLGLVAITGVTFSFRSVTLNRIGFQTNLVPLFFLIIALLFWRGWRKESIKFFVGAGIALGLSQYTYISARIFPAILAVFVVTWTILNQLHTREYKLSISKLWFGLLVVVFVSGIIYLPLGIFFLKNPGIYMERVSEVSLYNQATSGVTALFNHLGNAASLFLEGIVISTDSIPTFTWLEQIGFLSGLLVVVSRFRQPSYLFTFISLFFLWLPALLSTGPQSMTRLSGFLMPYYVIMAIGLIVIVKRLMWWLPWQINGVWPKLLLLSLSVLVVGTQTTYLYFYRWARSPEVYIAYNGPIVDLTQDIIEQIRTTDFVLPFQLYTYPVTRFLLHGKFHETELPPTDLPNRPATLITLPNPELIARLPRTKDQSFVWLTLNQAGEGVAYISHQELSATDLSMLVPVSNTVNFPLVKPDFNASSSGTFAQLFLIDNLGPVLNKFSDMPAFEDLGYNWDERFQLVGFQLLSELILPGQTVVLDLYWRESTEQPLRYKTVIELTDSRGKVVAEWHQNSFPEEMYRWRKEVVTRSRHRLFVSPQISPGPYLIWMEMLSPEGDNLVAYKSGERVGNRVLFDLLYVTSSNFDPRQPSSIQEVQFGSNIKLLGYNTPHPLDPLLYRGRLYWMAEDKIKIDYEIFVHLLDPKSQIVASWTSQPLAGQYPTSLWKTGQIVVDDFDLSIPVNLSAGKYQLVAGMLDPTTDSRLPCFDNSGNPFPNETVTLMDITIP